MKLSLITATVLMKVAIKPFVLVSLFNGIGGASVALSGLGVEPISTYYSEVDKYANIVYTSHYPIAEALGDVTTISKQALDEIKNLGFPILFIGGFPCKNLSFIGSQGGMSTCCNIDITSLAQYLQLKREGFNFKGQSFLFWELLRIKDILQPEIFIIENTDMSQYWKKIIDEAVGVKAIKINSSDFSPQSRVRHYWTNFDILPYKKNTQSIQDVINPNWVTPTKYIKGIWGNKTRFDKLVIWGKKSNTIVSSVGRTNTSQYIRHPTEHLVHKYSVGNCEVLQGLPIGFTSSVSDSRAFLAVGNGFEINTMKHLILSALHYNL